MTSKTKIQWTEATWNPIVGCTIATPGCANCYAMKTAWRMGHNPKTPQYHGLTKQVNGNAVWTGKMKLVEHVLTQPLKRRKPTMYFVNSMGDLFHENVPDEWIDQVFAVMVLCQQHTFQILTKRADRMRKYFHRDSDGFMPAESRIEHYAKRFAREIGSPIPVGKTLMGTMPFPNVWLGVSVEDQTRADERIPLLLDTPAAVRFVSAEPLLSDIDLDLKIPTGKQLPELDWVIVTGESGPKARPMHPDWARGLRDQCVAAGVPFFFKQWGEWISTIDRDVDDPDWRLDYSLADREPSEFRIHNLAGGTGFHGERVQLMHRHGTKAAGNLLDGKEWLQMPEVQA